MPELITEPSASTSATVAAAALRAAPFLALRQFAAQTINVLGGLILARMLSPEEFGVFAIAIFVHGALLACSVSGVVAGLVREADEPDIATQRAAFSVAQGVSLVIALLAWCGAPGLAHLYGQPEHATSLFRLLGVAGFAASFQAIPAALLERRMDFGRLAVIEVGQILTFYVVSIGLVLNGVGPVSFGYGFLVRAITGTILASRFQSWRWGYGVSIARLWRVVRFGVPFQATIVVSLLKDSLTPVLVGMSAGAAAVGYVAWAQAVAGFPVLATMILQRLFLVAFARLQDRRAELGRLVEQTIRVTHALVAPVAVLTLVLIEPIVDIGFGPGWRAALPVFCLLWVGNFFAPSVTAAMALLNALGASRTVFLFSLVWLVATWVFGAPLVWWFGALGYGMANVVLQGVNLVLIRMARERAAFSVVAAALPVWVWAGIVGVGVRAAEHMRPPVGVFDVIALFALGLVAYVLGGVLVAPRQARSLWRSLRGGE